MPDEPPRKLPASVRPHRRGDRRGAAGRQRRRGKAAARWWPSDGDGRRRNQRRRRPGPGRPGPGQGTGTDAAVEASDLTLVRGDLLAVPDAILLSRRALATIKGNLFWAFGYKTAVIPLTALEFLNPPIAGAAMAFSSVFVVSNSLRLRRSRPAGHDTVMPAGSAG